MERFYRDFEFCLLQRFEQIQLDKLVPFQRFEQIQIDEFLQLQLFEQVQLDKSVPFERRDEFLQLQLLRFEGLPLPEFFWQQNRTQRI